MNTEPKLLEKEAYNFLAQEKFEEAFRLFERAAGEYKRQGNHHQAAFCYSSAGSCWSKRSGEKTFTYAAKSYEEAAKEAQKNGDYEYASLLFKYAAINYERDGEFLDFSESFYHSKESYRRFLTYRLMNPGKIHPIIETKEERGVKGFVKRIGKWVLLTFSCLIWGHGERPARTFFSAILIVCLASVLYTFGVLIKEGMIFKPDLFEAFYFSTVTFTTVGYGDITPIGINKIVAMLEAFSGIFVMPLFVISLSRKYLRV
ncbi:MAG: ion channel [Candidatus Omnitrophota bacterium]